jgi:DNA helicase-2/ATP-dependent DNA helicase PcrA
MVSMLKKLRLELKNVELKKVSKKFGIDTKNTLNYEESLKYLYLYLELIGIQNFKQYEYCVVDEGQDFNILEYMLLDKLVIFNRFCVLGDLNQGYTENGLNNWDDLSETIGTKENRKFFTLETNYRSTKPIIEIANSIINPYTDSYLPKSINRVGPQPNIRDFKNKENLIKQLSDDLNEDTKNLDKSIGIICLNDFYFEDVKSVVSSLNIDEERKIELREDKRITYLPKGVYYTMFKNCKGLEFSKVYVIGLDLNKVNDIKSAKMGFVAVTRAMNELNIFYVK